MNLAKRRHATPDSARSIMCPRFTPKRRGRFIGLGSASTGHWPINRRGANKLGAYGGLPGLVGKKHYRALLLSTLAGTPGSAILYPEKLLLRGSKLEQRSENDTSTRER